MACWSCRKSRNWCRDTVKQLAAAASMQALTRRGTYRHIGVTPASRRAVTARSVTSRMLSTKDANCRDLSAGDSVSITSYVAATLPRSTRKPTTTSGGDSSRATGTAAMVVKPSPLRLQCTHTGPDSLLVGYTHPAAAPRQCPPAAAPSSTRRAIARVCRARPRPRPRRAPSSRARRGTSSSARSRRLRG